MDILLATIGGIVISECCRWYWRNDFFQVRWEICCVLEGIWLSFIKMVHKVRTQDQNGVD